MSSEVPPVRQTRRPASGPRACLAVGTLESLFFFWRRGSREREGERRSRAQRAKRCRFFFPTTSIWNCETFFLCLRPVLSHQFLRLQARSQPARLHHGHGHRQQQARARGVAGGVDRAGDAGDRRVLPPQDGVGGRHCAPELGHGLLHALALAGAEARDDDRLAAERERVGIRH